MQTAQKYLNLGLNNGVLPTGYTAEEARAQLMENLAKLPKRNRMTEVERIRLEIQAGKASSKNPENSYIGLHYRIGTRTVNGELSKAAEAEQNDGSGKNPLENSSKETIERESRELIERAKENGFFLTPEDIDALTNKSEPLKGGTEHDILLAGEDNNSIIIRNTIDGTYGYLDGASPTQYFRRLARNNLVFPITPIHLIGVSEGKDGKAVIWTAQPFVNGKTYDNERKFSMAMSDHGWEPHNRPNSYIHKKTCAVIRDASKPNVLYVGDELFPIDVIVENLPNSHAPANE